MAEERSDIVTILELASMIAVRMKFDGDEPPGDIIILNNEEFQLGSVGMMYANYEVKNFNQLEGHIINLLQYMQAQDDKPARISNSIKYILQALYPKSGNITLT
jgi:hypothetical protein